MNDFSDEELSKGGAVVCKPLVQGKLTLPRWENLEGECTS